MNGSNFLKEARQRGVRGVLLEPIRIKEPHSDGALTHHVPSPLQRRNVQTTTYRQNTKSNEERISEPSLRSLFTRYQRRKMRLQKVTSVHPYRKEEEEKRHYS